MGWEPSHHAPRDRAVWLFLPSASWKADANGRPTEVAHKSVVGRWDKSQSAWIDIKTGNHVYPSLWCDAPPDGVMPDNPLLKLA
jgi:hypothetical protein